MDMEAILAHCLSQPGAYVDRPFGEYPVCCKVGGRIFAQLYPDGRVTVKGSPEACLADRAKYPEAVFQAGAAQWAFWNTADWSRLPQEALLAMLDRSYTMVLEGLPKRLRDRASEPQEEPKSRWKRRKKRRSSPGSRL